MCPLKTFNSRVPHQWPGKEQLPGAREALHLADEERAGTLYRERRFESLSAEERACVTPMIAGGIKGAFSRYVTKRAYRRYFRVVAANTPELLDTVYRIRYAVYCQELAYENKDDFPDGREKDAYDDHSLHCLLLHRPSGQYIGCIRLVLAPQENNRAPFPFELACRDQLYDGIMESELGHREQFGEISRLAVVSRFRRRKGEYETPAAIGEEELERSREERRITPYVALCLSLGAAAMGLSYGLSGVFALMEPRLERHLRNQGIGFRKIGKPVEYRGLRIPFFITREDLYASLPPSGLALLEIIQEDLAAALLGDCIRDAG